MDYSHDDEDYVLVLQWCNSYFYARRPYNEYQGRANPVEWRAELHEASEYSRDEAEELAKLWPNRAAAIPIREVLAAAAQEVVWP